MSEQVKRPDDLTPVTQSQFEEYLQKRLADPLDKSENKKALDGVMVYGAPMNKKKKKAIQWAKDTLSKENVTIKKEVFEFTCPLNWIFAYSQEKGWFQIYIGDFLH